MNEVKTNSFNGLNRLPEIAEGEGAVFKGLSLKSYPAAESEGIRRTGAVYISLDGVDIAIDGGKLQAVGDIVLRDGKFYLTGVYEGVFYYEGAAVEYYGEYGEDRKLGASDRVEIVKAGKQYIILGVHPNGKSAVWLYNTVGTSIGTEEDRAGDGKLKSEIIYCRLPKGELNILYLYKIATSDDGTKATDIESASKKSYYMLYMGSNNHTEAQIDKGRKFPKEKEAMDMYNRYKAFIGSQIIIKPSGNSFDEEKYCFNDGGEEHPVIFVLDAACVGTGNGGEIDVIEELYMKESGVSTSYFNRNYTMLNPFTPRGTNVQFVNKYKEDGTLEAFGQSPSTEGSGIIGHFEVWNDEFKRYEPYYSANPIYKITGGKDKAFNLNTSGGGASYTAITIDYAGIINESTILSHITTVGNRIFATVKGGEQIMYSASGKFTNFAEVLGAGSDSGFFSDSTEGDFTGLSEYSGTLLAFKENRISVYYGTPPNMTRSRDITGVGCIDCRSIKEVRGVLYFLAKDGFYAYSGGMPKRISRKLSRKYVSATAFEREGCYVANAVCEDGEMEILTYNPELDMWTENDGVSILAEDDGKLISEDGAVFEYCDSGSWCYETGDIFEGIFEEKGINEIYIRGRINGSFKVTTVSDDEEFEHSEITDDTMRLKVWRIPVRLKHKNHYRIRVEGSGRCVLYALERSSYIGGKKR